MTHVLQNPGISEGSRPQALLLSVRRSVYFYIILKVGKWPGWGSLTYSIVWPVEGMCRQVDRVKPFTGAPAGHC